MDRPPHAPRQAALIAVLALAACVPPPARVPMTSIARPAAAPAPTLIVFLPGRGSDARTFLENGFTDDEADLVFADATERYYFDGSIVDRLHDDVIGPARARGYDHVWLVGVSLGGLGAVLYAKAHPDEIDGLVLLAPYLGDDAMRREIEDAGGLGAWRGESGGGDFDGAVRRAWAWLRDTRVPVWLGYGRGDRLRRSHALLAATLPPQRVVTVDGGHDWPVWRALWKELLARSAAG